MLDVFTTDATMNWTLEALRYTRAPISLEALNLPRESKNVSRTIHTISRDVFPKAQ